MSISLDDVQWADTFDAPEEDIRRAMASGQVGRISGGPIVSGSPAVSEVGQRVDSLVSELGGYVTYRETREDCNHEGNRTHAFLYENENELFRCDACQRLCVLSHPNQHIGVTRVARRRQLEEAMEQGWNGQGNRDMNDRPIVNWDEMSAELRVMRRQMATVKQSPVQIWNS